MAKKQDEGPAQDEQGDLMDKLDLSDAREPEPSDDAPVPDSELQMDSQPTSDPTPPPAPPPSPPRRADGTFARQTEPEAEPPADAQPDSEPTEPPPTEEVNWKERAEAAERRLQAQSQGFQRTITGLRQQQREQPLESQYQPRQLTPEQHQQAEQQGIPIEFTNEGQPFIPAAAVQQMAQRMAPPQQPMHPEQLRRTALGRIQQSFINADPVNNAGPTNAVFDAVEMANTLLGAKQAELGGYHFNSGEEMVDFVEQTGIGQTLRQQYPFLRTEADVEALVEGTLTMSPRKFARLVDQARTASSAPRSPQPSTPTPQARMQQLPPSKPRSHVTRGGPQPQSATKDQRLEYLDAKNPIDLTAEEAKELEGYLR